MVVHELGHALGFFHEHQRWDRDRYVIDGVIGQWSDNRISEGDAWKLRLVYGTRAGKK